MAWREAVGLDPAPVSFTCPVCRSNSFFQTAEGYYVCDVCFTQSQEHGALEVNELDPTLMSFRSRAGVKRARARADDAPQVAPLAAFQEILRMQVETLITKFGCNDLLYPLMAKLWVQYTSMRVKVYAQIDEERREIEAGKKEEASPLTGNALLMLGVGDALMEMRVPQQPTPSLSLCFCYVACAMLREPVTTTDIVLWANKGSLPYEGVYVDFHGRVKNLHLIRPKYHATVAWVQRTSVALAQLLDLPPLPPPNIGALADRYLADLLLPAKHLTAVLRIASRISLKVAAEAPPHSIVFGVIIVLLKILWDPENSAIPLADSDLPAFDEWARALHTKLKANTPIFAANLEVLLRKPREFAKYCDEQVLPLTTLREMEPVIEILNEINNSAPQNGGSGEIPEPEPLSPSGKIRPLEGGVYYTRYEKSVDGDLHPAYLFLLQMCDLQPDAMHKVVQRVERELFGQKGQSKVTEAEPRTD